MIELNITEDFPEKIMVVNILCNLFNRSVDADELLLKFEAYVPQEKQTEMFNKVEKYLISILDILDIKNIRVIKSSITNNQFIRIDIVDKGVLNESAGITS